MAKRKIAKKIDKKAKKDLKCCDVKTVGCGGCGYFLGFIGAAVYYISSATSFGMGVLGLLKAMVWPAFLVFELLKYLAV